MCHFITLVVERDQAAAAAQRLKRHGRNAMELENASLRTVLFRDEVQFITTRNHCDCGTVFGSYTTKPEFNLERERQKYKKKGWSEGKIKRALQDREKVAQKPKSHRHAIDSYEFWGDVVTDIISNEDTHSLGLFVHFYSGGLSEERFVPERQDILIENNVLDALRLVKEDSLTMLHDARPALERSCSVPHKTT